MNRNLLFVLGLLVLVVVAVLAVVLNRQPNSVPQENAKPNDSAVTRESKVRSPIKSDEQVIFYPTIGWARGDQETPDWEFEIRGCIFEAGRHAAGVKLLRELTGIDERQLNSDEAQLFQQRAEFFAVDHERDKAIPIRIGEKIYTLRKSGAGEQDPNIYAGLARDYPEQVSHIFIRNVTDEPRDAFREIFAGLPDELWQVFREPSEIKLQSANR